jgi:hypothetical protein
LSAEKVRKGRGGPVSELPEERDPLDLVRTRLSRDSSHAASTSSTEEISRRTSSCRIVVASSEEHRESLVAPVGGRDAVIAGV